MDLEMLQEVVPMLKQQLEKSMLDRNYVQLERVRSRAPYRFHDLIIVTDVLSVKTSTSCRAFKNTTN